MRGSNDSRAANDYCRRYDHTRREKKTFGQRLKQIITQLNTIDTTYIQPNDYTWTAMMQNTNFLHFVIITSATEKNKERQSLTFFPRPSFKIGPFLGWRWLFLGYTH